MYAYEFVWCCCNMKVWLFFIDEERIGNPNIFDKLGPDGECLNALPFPKRQSRVSPELPKVEIQSEILSKHNLLQLFIVTVKFSSIMRELPITALSDYFTRIKLRAISSIYWSELAWTRIRVTCGVVMQMSNYGNIKAAYYCMQHLISF